MNAGSKSQAFIFAWALVAGLAPGYLYAADGSASDTPLYKGGYLAPMFSYLKGDKDGLGTGYGGTLAAGYRDGKTALEIAGFTVHYADSAVAYGGNLSGLYFPFNSFPNTFGILGLGMQNVQHHPSTQASDVVLHHPTVDLVFTQVGVGQLWKLSTERYEFGIRTEVQYRYSWRNRIEIANRADLDFPRRYDEFLLNIGLQLPLNRLPPPAPPPPAAVEVVKPVDTDGDGVTDDLDKCPDTPAGTQVNEQGCPLTPPCKTPTPGEKIDLSGCATGDVIVLRGVNFEFNESRLTVNAKTLLDDVAAALLAQSRLHVEISGHTDSKGSDEYNQRLSEERAASVMNYLIEKGVAADHLSSTGRGEMQPVADNETDEGRELNRRVELKILSRDESPIAASTASDVVPAKTNIAVEPTSDAVPPVEAAPAAGDAAEAAPAIEAMPAEAVPSTDPGASPGAAPGQ